MQRFPFACSLSRSGSGFSCANSERLCGELESCRQEVCAVPGEHLHENVAEVVYRAGEGSFSVTLSKFAPEG